MASQKSIDIIIEAHNRASKELSKLYQDMNRVEEFGRTLQDVSKGFLMFGGAVAGGAGLATAQYAKLEQVLADTASIMGRTKGDFTDLEKTAREYGNTTSFTAEQSGQAMKVLAQYGYGAKDMQNLLNTTIKTSTAHQYDLTRATEILVSQFKVWEKQGYTIADISDVMSKATNISSSSMERFRYSLKYLSPMASELGVSFEEMTAQMALLSDAGINAETVGTSLRSIYSRLLDPSKQAKKVLEEYGLTMEELNPQTQGFANVIETVSKANMSAGDTFAVFGQEASSAINAFTGRGADALREYEKQLNNASGTMEQMYDTQVATLIKQLQILWSKIKEFSYVIGKVMMPYIKQAVSALQSFMDWLNGLDQSTKKTIAQVIILTGVVASIAGIFLFASGTLVLMATAMTKLKGQLSALGGYKGIFKVLFAPLGRVWGLIMKVGRAFLIVASHLMRFINPVTIVITTVISLAVLLYKAWTNNWFGIRDKTKIVMDAVTSFIQKATNWIVMAWNKTINWFKTLPAKLNTWIVGAWQGVVTWVTNLVSSLRTSIFNFFVGILTDTGQTQAQAVATVRQAWTNIKNFFIQTFNILKFLFFDVWVTLFNFLKVKSNQMWQYVVLIWNGVYNYLATKLNQIKVFFSAVWNAIWTTILKPILMAIWNFIKVVWTNIVTQIQIAMTILKGIISASWSLIWGVIRGILSVILGFIKASWTTITNFTQWAWQSIKSVIDMFLQIIKNIIAFWVNLIAGNWDEAWQNVINILETVWETIWGIVDGGLDTIIETIEGWFNIAKNSGEGFMTAFADGVSGAIGAVTGAIDGVLEKARNFLPFSDAKEGPLSDLTLSGYSMMTAFAKGATQAKSLLSSKIGNTLSGAMNGGMSGKYAIEGMRSRGMRGGFRQQQPSAPSNNVEKIEININGADEQDREALADEVMRQIQDQLGEG
ncbi:phage tail tape measure protein (plasmid) [Halobacillus litoralis]|uniref:phage tail tape measure protein n=1 Tax=Halobacillus litoralis TaxID=45668 RepID=UPI001CFF0720|nr:phage tail tape measure protein [Halobacillus litoralis]WLR49595.1 phage tail tape measure protein [Halobacillus litoralis]